MKSKSLIVAILALATACSDDEMNSPEVVIDNSSLEFFSDEPISIKGSAMSNERNLKSIVIEFNNDLVYEQYDINQPQATWAYDTMIARTGIYSFYLKVHDSEGLESAEMINCEVKNVVKPLLQLDSLAVHTDTALAVGSAFAMNVIVRQGTRLLDSLMVSRDSASNVILGVKLDSLQDSVYNNLQFTADELGKHVYILQASDVNGNRNSIMRNITIE